MPQSERVLCVPTAAFHRLGLFQGFCPDADRYLDALLVPGVAVLRPRSEVEDDPGWKQMIPYQFLVHGECVFCYRRGPKGCESRLHERLSLGIGGHINEFDFDVACRIPLHKLGWSGDVLPAERAALLIGGGREFAEEIELTRVFKAPAPVYGPRVVGLINDDSNPVGAVHLGVAMRLELDTADARPLDGTMEAASFLPWQEARARRPAFESWSCALIDQLPSLLG